MWSDKITYLSRSWEYHVISDKSFKIFIDEREGERERSRNIDSLFSLIYAFIV